MAIAEITKYLQGSEEYTDGVKLYEKFGTDNFLKRLFAKGFGKYNRDRLRSELEKLNQVLQDPPAPAARFTIENSSAYDTLPLEIKELNSKKDSAFKEMRDLHSRLLLMSPRDRSIATFRILDLEKQVKHMWQKLDHYAEHKKIAPEDPLPVIPSSLADLIRRRTNLRCYVSKGRIKYQVELDLIEKKIADAEGKKI